MSKMNNREMILLVVLCNFAVILLFQQLAIKRVTAEREELITERQELENEISRVSVEVASYPNYLLQIEDLKNERQRFYATCFPEANPELIHVFVRNKTLAANLDAKNISLTSKQETTTNEEGKDVDSIFKNNTANMQITGPYSNFINFILDLEGLNRTYRLSTLNMAPQTDGSFNYSASLHFFTVQKDTEDDIFDYDMGTVDEGNLVMRFEGGQIVEAAEAEAQAAEPQEATAEDETAAE